MKFLLITFFAVIACASAAPSQITNNNVGDIVTVGIKGSIDYSNQVDITVVNFIWRMLNQQLGLVIAPANEIEPAAAENSQLQGEEVMSPPLPQQEQEEVPPQPIPSYSDLKLTPEMIEMVQKYLNEYQQH